MKNQKSKFYSKLACIAVTLSMLFSMYPYAALAADKNNAVQYEIGTTINAAITEDSPEIYYVFELEESGVVEATLKLDTWEMYSYKLFDDGGNELYGEYGQDHTGDFTWVLSSGVYYLRFYKSRGYGTFSFKTSFESANVNHDEDNAEKNNAAEISLNKEYNSIISKDKDSEYFKFDLEESGIVNATVKLESSKTYSYQLYDDYGNELYGEWSQNHTGDFMWILTSGRYYLRFYEMNGGYGAFSFATSFESANVNHDEDNAEKNNAAEISLNKEYNSIISKNKDSEYFKFKLEEPSSVNVEIELGTWEAYSYRLYDDYGNELYYEDDQNHTGDITWDLIAGTYYLYFHKWNSGYGTFSFILSDGGTVINNSDSNSVQTAAPSTPRPVNNNSNDDEDNETVTPANTPKPQNNNISNNSGSQSSYRDVNTSDSYYTPVTVLSERGIINGYEDGSFKPDNRLTRAEFTKMIVTLLGKDSEANAQKGYSSFTDVGSSHWASGYINVGVNEGIINGYGLGYFGPEDNVTYSQTVKMLVSAAGHDLDAQKSGGWPTGYMAVGSLTGITDGMSIDKQNDDLVSRGEAAILMYNTLMLIE